jgi:putative transposase
MGGVNIGFVKRRAPQRDEPLFLPLHTFIQWNGQPGRFAAWFCRISETPAGRSSKLRFPNPGRIDMVNFKGMRFPIDVILVRIRWYAAYPLSYRHLEELMQERRVSVDHSSINRWAIRLLPLIEQMARKHKRPVGSSWSMDETYIKVKGVWKYLYRAVDKQRKTVDFLLTAKRDMAAAKRFFDKAMEANGSPKKIATDKSGANKAAINTINAGRSLPILVPKLNISTKLLNKITAP